jgi:hypothetical protein
MNTVSDLNRSGLVDDITMRNLSSSVHPAEPRLQQLIAEIVQEL